MISLQPLIALLKAKPAGFAKPWFRQVGGVGDYSLVDDENLPAPAVWIVRATDKNTPSGERAENYQAEFDVVFCIPYIRRDTVDLLDDDLLAYRVAVRNLLLGYEIAGQNGDIKPVQGGNGRTVRIAREKMIWADRYTFTALLTNYLPDPPAFSAVVYTGA